MIVVLVESFAVFFFMSIHSCTYPFFTRFCVYSRVWYRCPSCWYARKATRATVAACTSSTRARLSRTWWRHAAWWRHGGCDDVTRRSKTEPEMYEFVCRTADERRVWIQTLRDAIISCSQEGSMDRSSSTVLLYRINSTYFVLLNRTNLLWVRCTTSRTRSCTTSLQQIVEFRLIGFPPHQFWNTISLDIRMCASVLCFRRQLRTFFPIT